MGAAQFVIVQAPMKTNRICRMTTGYVLESYYSGAMWGWQLRRSKELDRHIRVEIWLS